MKATKKRPGDAETQRRSALRGQHHHFVSSSLRLSVSFCVSLFLIASACAQVTVVSDGAALTAAAPMGGSIALVPGSTYEVTPPLVLAAGTVLVGNGATIVAAGPGPLASTDNRNALLDATDATIVGVTLRGAGHVNSGVRSRGSLRLIDCRIHDYLAKAVHATGKQPSAVSPQPSAESGLTAQGSRLIIDGLTCSSRFVRDDRPGSCVQYDDPKRPAALVFVRGLVVGEHLRLDGAPAPKGCVAVKLAGVSRAYLCDIDGGDEASIVFGERVGEVVLRGVRNLFIRKGGNGLLFHPDPAAAVETARPRRVDFERGQE